VAGIFLSGFALAVGIIGLLLWSRIAWRIATDVPNGRSLHIEPIPRVGGWGLVPAALIAVVAFGATSWLLLGVALALFIASYADDRKGLPVGTRLAIHCGAAAAVLAWGPFQLPLGLAVPAAIGLVWITNLFNFMDGADGLAGGMAVFAFSIYGAVAAASGISPLAYWSMAFAGASAGFLLFNFSPARVFLGDAGSVTVGFFAGAFGVWGWAVGIWPFWFPFLVAAPFFLDASVTLARRVIRGEKIWKAHREHYYQRLIRSGWSHRRTALCEYLVMACSALLALVMLDWSPRAQYVGLGVAAVAYGAMAYAIDSRWSRFARIAEIHLVESEAVTPTSEARALTGTESASQGDDVIAYAQAYDAARNRK
jgi:UDP-N-acetylmuramyl pentapeptide phosphotransferase/UDP-N-acetylglucosamine-1-phosphate transferase